MQTPGPHTLDDPAGLGDDEVPDAVPIEIVDLDLPAEPSALSAGEGFQDEGSLRRLAQSVHEDQPVSPVRAGLTDHEFVRGVLVQVARGEGRTEGLGTLPHEPPLAEARSGEELHPAEAMARIGVRPLGHVDPLLPRRTDGEVPVPVTIEVEERAGSTEVPTPDGVRRLDHDPLHLEVLRRVVGATVLVRRGERGCRAHA